MPIHEFQCKSCDYVFELLLMTKKETENVRCPKCQSPEVGKLMSAPNISVDGGGGKASGYSHRPSVQEHRCKSGSCTNINIPGYSRD